MPEDQHPIDDTLAEDALAALAGRECEHGGGLLDPRTAQCEDESHTHCRWFCGDAYCRHQLLSWHDESKYEEPEIPLPPTWLGPVDEWPDEWKQAAFGDLPELANLFAEIEDGRLQDHISFEIAGILAERLPVPVHAEHWEQLQSHASGCGTVVYAKNPGQARAELVASLDRLRQGFEHLAVAESGIQDLQAEEALAILADLECPNCNALVIGPRPWFCSDCSTAVCSSCQEISNAESCGHLLPTEGRPGWDQKTCVACGEALQSWKCTRCLSVHCPFCGVRSWAWRGSSWTLGGQRCPHLIASWDASAGEWGEEPDIGLDQLEGIAIDGYDWAAVRVAFGKLTRLAVALEDAQQTVVGTSLLDTLIQAAGLTSVVDVFWDDANGMGSDSGTDYFAADPAEACTALRALVDRLLAGQDRLAAAGEKETPR